MRRLAEWVATIGGVGYCPIAPGTAGSVAGVALGLATVRACPASVILVWLGLGLALAVLVSGMTERARGILDPSFVVIDECWAMWAILVCVPEATRAWGLGVLAFVSFRFFDVVKPPPLKRLARLPGGVGIVFDDVGAAAYTILVLWLVMKIAGCIHAGVSRA